MDDNKRPHPEKKATGLPSAASDVDQGPVGRTKREEQRRRLIVAGMATPALMTLPSRRVWASKCSKSKLLSGNLSAKKKPIATDCEPLGCGKSFWKGGNLIRGIDWTLNFFDDELGGDPQMRGYLFGGLTPGSASLLQAVSGAATVPDKGPRFGTAKDKIKDCAREATASYLNAVFIDWPTPNDVFNFEMTKAQVITEWQNALKAAFDCGEAAAAEEAANQAGDKMAEDQAKLAKDAAKAEVERLEKFFHDANKQSKVCPF